ncbi:urease accessory protein UreD [Methylocapsa sp. S129]|uniref:urease accessory protein UreD n=1 Tax=Methylocapsa sp. S129 TaxID=1641869 RepID=UPI00131B42A5|nr:urease accessory protein UreD [Methylocapsa sp. S129]
MTGPQPEVRAQLDLALARRGDRTVLDRRLFRWPFVLTRTFALDRAPSHMLTVILQTSSGATHGEDRLRQRFHVGGGAAAHVATQGASLIHRAAPGVTTEEKIAIRIEEGGYFEYLPEPRILFPDAALDQTIEIDCAVGGVALISDAFTTHDPEARGRGFRSLASTMILRCGGDDAVLVDRIDIRSLGQGRTAQFRAFGAMTLAAPGRRWDSMAAFANALSATLATIPDLYAAASLLPDETAGLGVRLAGRDLRAVRAGIQTAWNAIRCEFYGVPPPSRRKG